MVKIVTQKNCYLVSIRNRRLLIINVFNFAARLRNLKTSTSSWSIIISYSLTKLLSSRVMEVFFSSNVFLFAPFSNASALNARTNGLCSNRFSPAWAWRAPQWARQPQLRALHPTKDRRAWWTWQWLPRSGWMLQSLPLEQRPDNQALAIAPGHNRANRSGWSE